MNKSKLDKRLKYMQKYPQLFAMSVSDMTLREKKRLMKFYSQFSVEELYNIAPKHFHQAMEIYDDLVDYSSLYMRDKRYLGFILKNVKNTWEDYTVAFDVGAGNDLTLLFWFLVKCTLLLGAEVVCLPVTIPLQIGQAIYNRAHNPLKDTSSFSHGLYNYLEKHDDPPTETAIDERILDAEIDMSTRKPQEIKAIFAQKHNKNTTNDVFLVGSTKTTDPEDLISKTFDQSITYQDDIHLEDTDFSLPNIDIK